ncbi:hypothetical protein PCCS19_07720 [Paenibacillus sp. CCS19]|uniref:ABC transporter ATP-binding protein/permease n=1 Tax=Paenibacillus sp. CCS19 TaxID=3158387 RepID=UPI00255E104B|nr:ABC transporter ATP-binding protein/permease [Paenibacillus cellulosilyticus]GMK37718.1 hypothetical protein PCCS19_07720 [Paenibacillus cellulosilyticus]
MIELRNVDKTFFKGKANEVRAIRQTSMTFPDRGLVVLCGPSGSGKTTLLNVLGGLEYIDSGEIKFGDTVIGKRNARQSDAIRNERIGYIFQQYYLLPYMTVFENIELVLKMLGLKDKAEIERRIRYVLEVVGMYNYRHRKVSALSGGQQQRAGIARAIAKNPDMIIADEPTGNLDSRNTVEIMNIIKKISEQKLVVLVTHERELANFYGDRIIEISDGRVVSDTVNEHQGSLDIRHQNTIYLKDLQKQSIAETPVPVEWYSDSRGGAEGDGVGAASSAWPSPGMKVTLITSGDSLYIQVHGGQNEKLKVRYVDDASGITVLDEHFKGLDQETVRQYHFDPSQLESASGEGAEAARRTGGSAISTREAFRSAFRKLWGYSKLQKLMFLSFVFAAMLIAVAISLIGKFYDLKPEEFQVADRHYVMTTAPLSDLEGDAAAGASVLSINPFTHKQSFDVNVGSFYQVNYPIGMEAHPSDIELLDKDKLIAGHYPEKFREVVLEAWLVRELLKQSEFKQAGVSSQNDFIGMKLSSSRFGYQVPLTIVGISDTGSPTVWMNDALLYEMAENVPSRATHEMGDVFSEPPVSGAQAAPLAIGAWEAMDGYVKLLDGAAPANAGEVAYPEALREQQGYKVGSTLEGMQAGSGQGYTIVGFYQTAGLEQQAGGQREVVLATHEGLAAIFGESHDAEEPVLVYSKDVAATVSYLTGKGFEAVDAYDKDYKEYKSDLRRAYVTIVSFAIVLLGVSLLQLYFIIRSSLMTRIYEIGVLRALGASRWDMHKMFVIEIAVLTTMTSLIGYLLMTFIIKEVDRMISPFLKLFYFPLPYILAGVVLVYAINIASGLFPVWRLTGRSPSQILKHHDG